MNQKPINLSLTNDEAIVIFEFLSRFSETDKLSIEHQSEQRILWNLTNSLEKELAEPFGNNYKETLNKARENIEDQSE